MLFGLMLGLWAAENEEFFTVTQENANNGYTLEVIEGCRKPHYRNEVYLEDANGDVCYVQTPPSTN